ncbi:MAG: hypothetical protein ABSH31_20835 [Bryobacteraceae bacterium]|jgi:hypothetical protein
MKILRALLLLGIVLPGILLAQYPYPYPYPRTRSIAPGTPNPPAYKDVAGSFHGKLKELSSKEIMIETDDNQTVSIRRSRKTKFLEGKKSIKPTDIDLETLITIDASEDADLKLTAVNVTVDPPPKKNDDSK